MKSTSRIAIGTALALAATSFAFAPPALAQKKKKGKDAAVAVPAGPQLSKEERAAILPLDAAVTAKDWAAAAAALPAAEAGATGLDARYLVAARKLSIGLGTNNVALQAAAIDAMLATGKAEPATLSQLYKNQGILASNARNYPKAEAAYTKWVELNPNDPQAIVLLAEAKNSAGRGGEAVALIDRAILAKKAAGQPVEESWYKRGLKLAYDGKIVPQSLKFARDLVAAYPTKPNWRDAILIYSDVTKADIEGRVDAFRLMRASKALGGERDYLEFAELLEDRRLPGEAKAVLDEGVAVKMVDPNKANVRDLRKTMGDKIAEDRGSLASSEKKALGAATGTVALNTADGYMSYGEYAKAVPLYRAALQKGSIDANTANMRLGTALAMSGNKVEAETAFKAVTGPRAELAAYWLLWLSQSA